MTVTATGWTSGGDVVTVADGFEAPAVLSTGPRGGRMRTASLDSVCHAATATSVFPLPAPRIGLIVSCGGNDPRVAVLSFDPDGGRADSLAAVPTKDLTQLSSYGGGVWSDAERSGYVDYTTLGCYGIGTIAGGQVRPLSVTVPLPAGPVDLAASLPEVGGAGCSARVLAHAPALSQAGRYLAFFLHVCDSPCLGSPPEAGATPVAVDGVWRIVLQDRKIGRVDVLSAEFSRPRGLAVTDGGVVVASARAGTDGLFHCRTSCDKPVLLADGVFDSPNVHPDGTQLIAAQSGQGSPVYVALPQ